jgi:hypothetical protein
MKKNKPKASALICWGLFVFAYHISTNGFVPLHIYFLGLPKR